MTQTDGQQGRMRHRAKTGTVVSRSGAKTVSVIVQRLVRHARYGKYLKRRTKLAVHDPGDQAKVGDVVEIVPCRRISKSKAWRVSRVVGSGKMTVGAAELAAMQPEVAAPIQPAGVAPAETPAPEPPTAPQDPTRERG